VTPPDRPQLRRRDSLAPGHPTSGMRREEAFATARSWTGVVHTDPGAASGWHHHGDYETTIYVATGSLRLEYADRGGTAALDAGPGDFLFVPARLAHRELNPGAEESTAVLLRTGQGPPVVNLAGPDG
jgi:uncharacterized RmlC-like cupin family protein